MLFFVNGTLLTNWLPRIPTVKASLGLSEGALGLALLGVGAGALIGSLAASPLVARWGSRAAALVACVAMSLWLPLLGVASSAVLLGVSLAAVGFADAVMDVAMNAHGVEVQRRYGRSILNGFHGWWSLGSVTGGVSGTLAAAWRVPVAVQLGLVAALLCALALGTSGLLLSSGVDRHMSRSGGRRLRFTRSLALLGGLTLLGAAVEDTPGSWSAVYLREQMGTSPGVAGSAYAVFAVAMTIGRLLGDRLVDRFGAARTVRVGALLAAGGLAGGMAGGSVASAMVGFALTGLGVAPIFPATFGAAADLPDLPSGSGIAAVSLVARGGFLLAPPLVGFAAELAGLRLAVGGVAIVALAAALLAGSTERDTRHLERTRG